MKIKFTNLYKLIPQKKKINLKIKSLIKNANFVGGKDVKLFEKNFAKFVGSKYCISVGNGTDALEIALQSLNLKKGSEVIVPNNTWISTAEAVIANNLRVVFCDVNLDDYSICLKDLKKKVSKKTKCVLPVHYGGNPSDIIKIKNICKNKSIKIIEDAATAIGAKIGNKYVGSLNTDASVYSLYGNKVIVSGEGGIISAKNSKLEKKIRKIIFCGMDYSPFKRVNNKKENWKYNVTIPGYKYNMSDIQSSIALAQFSKIEKIISKRKIISDLYSNNFSELINNSLVKPIKILKNNSSSHYIYTLLINTESLKVSRNDLINYLKLKNIDTTVHYIPAHKHKFYSKMFKKFKLPNCNYVFDRIISLPMHENLSKHQINYVSNNVIKFIKQNTKKNFY